MYTNIWPVCDCLCMPNSFIRRNDLHVRCKQLQANTNLLNPLDHNWDYSKRIITWPRVSSSPSYWQLLCRTFVLCYRGPSWSWSCGSQICDYLYNQCLSPPKLWVRTPLWRGVPDTTLCDQVCQWLATGRCFLQVLRFSPPINWLPRYNWSIVESVVKHHRHKQNHLMLPCTYNTNNLQTTTNFW